VIDRTTRMRWRRRFRRSRRQVEGLSLQAEDSLEYNFFRRLNRLEGVRRFILAWTTLMLLLIGGLVMQTRSLGHYYLALKPAPGGTYTEGMVGAFTNANPLYAVGGVDGSVARLVFAGLFKYDAKNNLVGDLAERYTVNEKGNQYAVTLRKDLRWHDGTPITTEDVIFTYEVIKNPDAKSPLQSSWAGITMQAIDERTMTFTLPNALSAFPHSMTNGIVPKHLLSGVPMAQLRSVGFNTSNPVGSGPFKWEAVEVSGQTPETREQRVALTPNLNYHHGRPKLGRFIIRAFNDEKRLIESFGNRELDAAIGFDTVPDQFRNDPSIHEHNIPLTGAVYVFFKNSHEALKDAKVRQALTMAANTSEIIGGLGQPVLPARGPLLKSHLGYNKDLLQYGYNVAEANRLLDEAGWKKEEDGLRGKDGQKLAFQLYSQSTSDYVHVTKALQKQWRAVGVSVEVILQQDSDLQSTIAFHNYDALLYGISLGVDPDVFAYWHSSQADIRASNRLNFSEYKSETADIALEAGRTRLDPQLRAIKYQPFLEAWRADAPAIALYQPSFLYLTRGPVYGFETKTLNLGVDRLNNVHEWMIRQERAVK
jgi:peptide/nickel transport system substrate-binding protein